MNENEMRLASEMILGLIRSAVSANSEVREARLPGRVEARGSIRSGVRAQAEIQKLKVMPERPSESIITRLKSQRELMSISRTAQLLGRHRETLYVWIRSKAFPAIKQGRTWRVDPVRLAAWLESQ